MGAIPEASRGPIADVVVIKVLGKDQFQLYGLYGKIICIGKQAVIEVAAHPPVNVSFRKIPKRCEVLGPAHGLVHQRGGKGNLVVDLDPVVGCPGKRVPLKRRGKVVCGIGRVGNQRNFQPGMACRIGGVGSRKILIEVGVTVTIEIIARQHIRDTCYYIKLIRIDDLPLKTICHPVPIRIDQGAGDDKIVRV